MPDYRVYLAPGELRIINTPNPETAKDNYLKTLKEESMDSFVIQAVN